MNKEDILHTLRNPWGIDPEQIRRARLDACDLIEEQRRALLNMTEAYENMKAFAEKHGLDTAAYNCHDIQG